MEKDSIKFMDRISSQQGSVGCKEPAFGYKPTGSKVPNKKLVSICIRPNKNILFYFWKV
jgi:hypothetical protein